MLNTTVVRSSLSGAATTASLWHSTTHTNASAYAFAAKARNYAFTANKYGQGGTWGIIG